MAFDILKAVAQDVDSSVEVVTGVRALFGEGATIPFIARYRKEIHGDLGEHKIAQLQERLRFYTELQGRKAQVANMAEEKGLLTEDLRNAIESCRSRVELEDLALPFRKRRRSPASRAIDQGLEPLADRILEQKTETATQTALGQLHVSVEKNVETPEEAIKGATSIVIEALARSRKIRRRLRSLTWREGFIESHLREDAKEKPGKYKPYFDFKEPIRSTPSHRLLAIRRGERAKILTVRIGLDPERAFQEIEKIVLTNPDSIWAETLHSCIDESYTRFLGPQIETDIRLELRRKADNEAIEIFARNLENLLLSAPLPQHTVLAMDPGGRAGVKIAIVGKDGELLDNTTIYPIAPKNDIEGSYKVLDRLYEEKPFEAVAVGNSKGGREVLSVVRRYLKERERDSIPVVLVNQAGTSTYSTTPEAREELPGAGQATRSAVSIGRRLQDPLAELVKIDPKLIGVGQYQQDVDQQKLSRRLDQVMEFCVNRLGCDVNRASVAMLSKISGIGPILARTVVRWRADNGPFTSLFVLKEVPGFGDEAFQQAAGFLRVEGGPPFDATRIHPERYEVLEEIAKELGVETGELIGREDLENTVDSAKYEALLGSYTWRDILNELLNPKRSIRPEFVAPDYGDELKTMDDLEEGAVMEGTVTNVTEFGAFVDIGVQNDGLVHVSELSHRFVRDASQFIEVGKKVQVKVIEVNRERNRIGLSMKALETPPPEPEPGEAPSSDGEVPAPDAPRRRRPPRSGDDNHPRSSEPRRAPGGKRNTPRKPPRPSGPPPMRKEGQRESRREEWERSRGSDQVTRYSDTKDGEAVSTGLMADLLKKALEKNKK